MISIRAFANKQLPDLEDGAVAFMMSKSAYLFDAGDHNGPHVMFFIALKDGLDWGAGASGSPVCLKSRKPPLDTVSTVRGSGWVIDQHAKLLLILIAMAFTHPLPRTVLTVSKGDA